MPLLFLTEADVRRLLPMAGAIRLMRSVFEGLASGSALNQPRRRLTLPTGSILHSMAGAWGGYFGTKVYATHPRHGAHFAVLLYRAEDAVPLALLEANYLGQIRTGAVSGLATEIMARPNARTLGIFGTGFQARSQMEAVLAVRPIERVLVWSRTPERRAGFAADCAASFGVRAEPAASAEALVRVADVLTTATNSKEPVFESEWVAPGTHVNAVGSNHPRRRELPGDLLRIADLIVVDSLEQALIESGDLLLGLPEEDWKPPKVMELSEAVAGKLERRSPAGAVTVFKSNGLGVEDVAAAASVYEAALRTGAGENLPVYS